VADLVGKDAREERAELALGHLEALGADDRDGDGLGEAADAHDVARRGLEGRYVEVLGKGRGWVDLAARVAAEGLDHGAAEDAVSALLLGEAGALGDVLGGRARAVELAGEALEDGGGAVLIDHPAAPGALHREAERGVDIGDRGAEAASLQGEVEDEAIARARRRGRGLQGGFAHHATSIAGGIGGPQAMQPASGAQLWASQQAA